MNARLDLAAALLVALLAACNGGGGGAEGEGEGEGEGDGGNGGTVVAGCGADEECGAGEICDLATGDCQAGLDCTQNAGLCNFCGDPTTDCGFGDAGAYCSADAGVCRRTKLACGTCASDDECAESATGLPSVCADGFCAPGCGACPAGFACTDEATGRGCVPIAGSEICADAITCRDGEACPDGQQCSGLGVCLPLCNGDADCGFGDICETEPGPRQQQCVPGCPVGQHVNQDGVDLVCHADGHFAPPCPTEGSSDGCVTGTECDAAGVCQRAGCQSDAECPLVRTFCNIGTSTCVDGCNSDDDCGSFEVCGADQQCHPLGCQSKDISCDLGEWCCGKEAFADASTCPTGVDDGECFIAPDPWCRSCESNDDCAGIDHSVCIELQQNDASGNPQTIGKFCPVPCESNADCPRGVDCVDGLPTDQDGVTMKGCLDTLCVGIAAAH